MPLLFGLGMHNALVAVKAKLKEGERLFAFPDDVCVTCKPPRVLEVFQLLEAELDNKAHISVHQGRPKCGTGVDNRGGGTHSGSEMGETSVAWRPKFASGRPGSGRVGSPRGTTRVCSSSVGGKVRTAEVVGEDSPCTDVQAARLLLLFCASPRANFLLRTVQPERTVGFARNHDEMAQCLARVLQAESIPTEAKTAQSMPLTLGGLGIGGAERIRDAAHWGNWADCLETIKVRTDVATQVIRGFAQSSSWCCKAAGLRPEAGRKHGERPHRTSTRLAKSGVIGGAQTTP